MEKALKRFRRKVQKENILVDFKKKANYTKPSTEKHLKNKKLKRRLEKKKRKIEKRKLY